MYFSEGVDESDVVLIILHSKGSRQDRKSILVTLMIKH